MFRSVSSFYSEAFLAPRPNPKLDDNHLSAFRVCMFNICAATLHAVLHTLVAGLLARSQHPEGPAIGHLGAGFSWFPCV